MRRGLLWAALLACSLAVPRGQAQRASAVQPDDPTWRYVGKLRAAVKNRPPSTIKRYRDAGRGQTMYLDDLRALLDGLAPGVPSDLRTIASRPAAGVETLKVTVRAFILATKFERDGDHDLHVEVAARNDWDSPHLIVEIPPGKGFVKARRALWNMVRADRRQAKSRETGDRRIFANPPEVLITGAIFLDAPHAGKRRDFGVYSGGRGMNHPGRRDSRVAGLWEIHPVTELRPL